MATQIVKLDNGSIMEIDTATGRTNIRKAQNKQEAATMQLQGEGNKVVQDWLNSLKNIPSAVKKQAYNDAMMLLSAKGITNLDNLTKDQIDILRNALGNYGVRAVEWRKYYPNIGTATAPTAATKSRQNLTFSDMLKDLGLSGKEQANPEVLKKVNDWLAKRPDYKPGVKTNAYIKALQNMPTEHKKDSKIEITKNQQLRTSTVGKGYKFKNKSLYKDAKRAYKAGASTFVGNDGNTEFFNKYDINKFTVSDYAGKNVLNPNVIAALTSRF